MEVSVAISLATKEEDFVEISRYTGSMELPHLPAIGSTIGIWRYGLLLSFEVTSVAMIKKANGTWNDEVELHLKCGLKDSDLLEEMFFGLDFVKIY